MHRMYHDCHPEKDYHQENIVNFRRIQTKILNSPELWESVRQSIVGTKLYRESSEPHIKGTKRGEIKVLNADSFEVAHWLVTEGYRTAVLNMASATAPGGGVTTGSYAQEENLCHQSTLYPCLRTEYLWREFYKFHRERHERLAYYTDAAIYTPGVAVLATGLREQFSADVVSFAAPSIKPGMDTRCAAELIRGRIAKVMDICAANGDEAIVLGASGCGAFHNDPRLVSAEFRSLLIDDGYAKLFERTYIAILGRKPRGVENFRLFSEALGGSI